MFAKLRLHTDETISHLEELAAEFDDPMRNFRDKVCPNYDTYELARELAKRQRRK